ncbi:heterokaryon incompatibility protein-domain-containing protein [Aspergillus caelatus]|uniref:Heterokaryon incompatibility protein-domain-containing protein n=1 Tax=Aspergillus caelatus TaxID=61420 RepID=A0A5N7AKB3_9EURO|nr:heterokaryon incompatibility protein-domain-containing protein [Aspergillus caelatus]KAE8370332.1 heterokaryon incompatibility protein-domain-containing protein [Aspergillus caelatus]
MTLCELCQSIPVEDLPAFPSLDDLFNTGRYVFIRLGKDDERRPPDTLGFAHHPNIDSLRRSSAGGCELCHILEVQVDEAILEIEVYEKKKGISVSSRFGLWLTRRMHGGDGFVVLTPTDTTRGSYVLMLAAMVFCCDEGDPLASVFRGRLPKDTLDTAACDRFAAWVVDCNNQHSSCAAPLRSLPTRLIDVGSEVSGNLVKLVEVGEESHGYYVTLSYCWGGDRAFATTRSNVESQKKGICLHDLPRTYQDAIRMTRALQVQYLWIDRLCIYQDDSQDWERESTNMGSIYANAYLCISATSATSSTEGLVPLRTSRPSVRLPHMNNNCRGYIDACLLPSQFEFYKRDFLNLDNEPLSRRAWAFQERLFSRRSLLFASDKVYFVCERGFISEDGIELIDEHRDNYRDRHPYRSITDLGKYGPLTPDTARFLWYDLVRLYSRRSMTYPSDKLPAMSGIAKEYAKVLGNAYVAGLWREFLVDELAWLPWEQCTAASEYRAPSWSWASVDGPVGRPFDAIEPIASVLDVKIEVNGENPYGRVRSGWVKVEAPLLPLVLADNNSGSLQLKTVHGANEGFPVRFDTMGTKSPDLVLMIKTRRLFSLVLNIYVKNLGECRYFSLIVTPASDVNETWKRIGAFFAKGSQIGPRDTLTRKSTITLI